MDVVSIGAMKNPSALKDFIRLGGKLSDDLLFCRIH